MLPFLQKQKSSGGVTEITRPWGSENEQQLSQGPEDEHQEKQELIDAADMLIQAVAAKDKQGVVNALREAFDILDKEPHEEGPHLPNTEE